VDPMVSMEERKKYDADEDLDDRKFGGGWRRKSRVGGQMRKVVDMRWDG
jgi:hypothetical protein